MKPQEGIRIVVEDNDLAAIADHESEETLRSTLPGAGADRFVGRTRVPTT